MAFLCPVRIKKHKRKGVPPRQLDAPLPGRITGSDSIDTLVRVGYEKERGPRARMVVVHDFVPCVDDELAVKRNQQVQVLYQENDWLYVLAENGKEGFVPYNYCLPIERSVDDFVLPRSKKSYLTQDKCDKRETIRQSNLLKTDSKSMPDISCNNNNNRTSNNQITEKNYSPSSHRNININKGDLVTNKVSNHNLFYEQTAQENHNLLDKTRAKSHYNQSDSVVHDYYNLMPHVSASQRVNLNNSVQNELQKNASLQNCTSKNNQPNRLESSHVLNQSLRNKTGNFGKFNTISAAGTNSSHKYRSFRGQHFYEPPNNEIESHPKRSSSLYISSTESHIKQKSLPENCSHSQSVKSGNANYFSKHSYGQYIVLYSYSPRQENDIAVKRGEFVTLLNKDDEDWYWIRRGNSFEGFVPKNFLCPAEGQEDSSSKENHTLPKTTQSRLKEKHTLPKTTQSKSKPDEKHHNRSRSFTLQHATKLVCLYDYTSGSSDDLTVTRGQRLYADLESQMDPDWLWVYSTHTNKSGYIPRTYAEPSNFGTYANSRHDHFVSP